MRRVLFLLPLLLPVVLPAQHEKTGEESKNPFIGDPKAIEAGRKIFASGCAACHGPEGQGGRGPNLRESVYWHPLDDQTIYSAIRKGIGGNMPAANLSEDQTWQVVAFVRALTAPAIETPLATGDAKAGEGLFWGSAGCSGCHRILGRGGALGPDLSNIGATRALPAIREAILDPDANGARGYRSAEVRLKNGKRLSGVARNYTNYSVQLQDRDGNMHLISMQDVSEWHIGKTSPMPKDYKQRLSRQDIDNLLAYLSRQSVREVTPEKKTTE
ncbi:MAG TPA: c-type cytochrome [Bryobacteraceae bacterium]|nr:c-type cytochrome [Bryobacteraceae bacterium]